MRKIIIALFAVGMIVACTKSDPAEVSSTAPLSYSAYEAAGQAGASVKKSLSSNLQTSEDMVDTMVVLTLAQRDSLQGKQIIPPYEWYFGIVQDCDSTWVMTKYEADECTNPDCQWVKTLPTKLWCGNLPVDHQPVDSE